MPLTRGVTATKTRRACHFQFEAVSSTLRLRSAGDFADRSADAEPQGQVAELPGIVRPRVVQVGGFGDEPQVLTPGNAGRPENSAEWLQVAAVADQQLVLVELDFHRPAGSDDRDAGAAVIEQQVLELAEVTFEHRPINVRPPQIAVAVGLVAVAGFENDVHDFAERIEQLQEDIEQTFAADGRGQGRNAQARAGRDRSPADSLRPAFRWNRAAGRIASVRRQGTAAASGRGVTGGPL